MVTKLLIGLSVILIGAEIFTNAVEWLGNKLKLTEGAVGSLLAAVGTALPETMIPIIAFFTSSGEKTEVGIGAILGAPFMLGTLALCIVGCTTALSRKKEQILCIDTNDFCRDLLIFITMYALALSASFVHSGIARTMIIFALIIGYIFYVWVTLRSGGQIDESRLKPLYLRGNTHPSLMFIVVQLILGLICIVGGAHAFVDGIDQLANLWKISPLVLALIIAPIATELPEKFNSIIWIIQKKDRLALGNITGAMVFQSTLIPAFGIAVSPWQLNLVSLLSGVLVLLSSMVLYLAIKKENVLTAKQLMLCGVFYLCFLATIVWSCS